MRYAGFWPRLGALVVDLLVVSSVGFLAVWVLSGLASQTLAMTMEFLVVVVSSAYNIYFLGRWGQTIGKAVLGIRVVALDGSPAGFQRALYRHAVDLVLSLITAALNVLALASGLSATNEQGTSARVIVETIEGLWVASEFIVLFLNEKRRALHDFIAGTVVIHVRREAVGV